MTREREMERKTNARIVVVVGASEGRAPLSPTPAYSNQVRVGCALPTAPSAKNRGQGCLLRKSARRTKADFHSVHGRRPLHGQCHGLQWPWPSSGMLLASTDVARARRWSNHLAPSVSSGGAKQSC